VEEHEWDELLEKIPNKYVLCCSLATRIKQLGMGAKPTIPASGMNPMEIARREFLSGTVKNKEVGEAEEDAEEA
jgi:DNA-directed RNA polymerase subunit K/omega